VERERELSIMSQGGKKIEVLTVSPEIINGDTGLMLVLHGWGGNRYQYQDMMGNFSNRYNVVCISPEYRDSGFDVSPEGTGIRQPYDFSHLQVIDALTSFQAIRIMNPQIDRKRAFIWGGSQGGQIALLATEFAPHTFALTVDACGLVYPTDFFWGMAGWKGEDTDYEIRDTRRFVENIENKVIIFHGGKDEMVNVEQSYALEATLRKAGKEVEAHYYPEGDHHLKPVTTRMEATILNASEDLSRARVQGKDDFSRKNCTVLSCTGCDFIVDFTGDFPILKRNEVT